jgi:Peptidase A4 family
MKGVRVAPILAILIFAAVPVAAGSAANGAGMMGANGAGMMGANGAGMMGANGLELNWSGYVVGASNVTYVSGTFTVPVVSGPSSVDKVPTDVSVWAGIDGYASGTVEQAGVSGTFSSKTNAGSYYAWWELYPHDYHKISSVSVSAGDSVTASVTYSKGAFTLTLVDNSNGQSFTKTAKLSGAERNSAEWIVERGTLNYKGETIQPLATFSPVTFTGEEYAVGGGAAQALQAAYDSGFALQLVMYGYSGTTGVYLDSVSVVASNSFTVTFLANGDPYKL